MFTVLLIAKSPLQFSSLLSLWSRAGFRVEHAPNGSAGLSLCRTLNPDLVVVDACLDDGSGRDWCRILQQELPHVLVQLGGNLAAVEDRSGGMENLSLVEHLPEALFMLERSGVIHAVNRQAEALLGLDRSEFQGRFLETFLPVEDMEGFRAQLATLWEKKHMRLSNISMRNREDKLCTVDLTGTIVASAGTPMALLLAHDVTERNRRERRERQGQKMEAIGQLAGGIAHDFNNLLTIILGYSDLLKLVLGPDAGGSSLVEEIHKAAERAASLTRQLLAFSRQQLLSPRVVNLNTIVKDMEGMLRRLIGEHIDVTTFLDGDLWNVKVDPVQVEQIIMNLAINARDAMPGGGNLTMETANIVLDQAYAQIYPAVRPGEYVMLAVTDTGLGMDSDTKAHLFEPFFTTKEPGKGTGLGLATVYGIVKQSNGYIWAYSELGKGTTFKVYLPRNVDEADAVTANPSKAGRPRGKETILVVEDEGALRALIRTSLESQGYTVLEAMDPREALALRQRHPGPIDLLLADVVMPRMSGPQLAQALGDLQPGLKVLYMSGYPGGAIAHHGILHTRIAFLPKPFTPGTLARKVREVLDS